MCPVQKARFAEVKRIDALGASGAEKNQCDEDREKIEHTPNIATGVASGNAAVPRSAFARSEGSAAVSYSEHPGSYADGEASLAVTVSNALATLKGWS